MKKIVFYILLFFSILNIFGQQDPQISHYYFNQLTFNPAYAGENDQICFNFLRHQQWIKFEGAPQTNFLTADMPINIKGYNFGLGIIFVDDRYGFVRDFRAALPIAYKFDLGAGRMSVALQPGIFNKQFEPSWKFPERNENILNENRPVTVFDLATGVYFQMNNIFAGFSTSHLTRPRFYFLPDSAGNSTSIFLVNHFYILGGYNFSVFNGAVDLIPNFLIKSDLSSIQFDINILGIYNKKFWAGVSYRNKTALVFMVGTSYFGDVKLGFSYDLILTSINRVARGTLEAYIGYCFEIEKAINPQKYHNVKTL